MADTTVASVKAKKIVDPEKSTQRYLPFSEIRDNMIIMKDGSTRMALRVRAVNFNLKSEEEQDSIIYSYQRFLNSLRFPIQIVVRSLKVDIDSYINKLKNLAVKQKNPLLQEQAYRYIDFLINLIDMAQIMKKEFFIVIPFDDKDDKSVRQTWLVWVFRNFWAAITHEENVWNIRERRRKLEKMKKDNFERLMTVKWSLEQIWIKSEEVQKDELVKLLINYYNPKVNNETRLREDISKMNIEQ